MADALNVPYKIGPGERDDQLEWQGCTCWICNRDTPLVVDHDHATGAKRGLICYSCNSRVGWVDKHLMEINERGLQRAGGRRDFIARAIVNYVRSGGVWDVRLLDQGGTDPSLREPQMSDEERDQENIKAAVGLHGRGMSMDGIAEAMASDRATVRDLLNRAPMEWIREPGSMSMRAGGDFSARWGD